jgi:hypothetical protein
MRAWQHLALPLVVLVCSLLTASAAVRPLAQKLSLHQQQHTNNRTEDPWPTIMEPAKVAQTAELIGVETNVGTWSIGHATMDFLAGIQQEALLLRGCLRCCVVGTAQPPQAAEPEASLVLPYLCSWVRQLNQAANTAIISYGIACDCPAGAASGMVGIAAGQPLDTLRVRLQQRNCQQNSAAAVWKAMAKAEGVRGLFRGMSYPIYTTALQVGIAGHHPQLVLNALGSMICYHVWTPAVLA